MLKKILFLLLSLCCTVGIIGWQLHPVKNEAPIYVTSSACQSCHSDFYKSWSNTLHPKMFRPVTSDEDILGDFNLNDPVLTFTRDEVEYVVGNHWEQVYVRKIDGEYFPLPARWLVKQQKWSAYKVDSWHKTPMSEKCNGCHTTGFDPATYEFSEFGIGCEACHGPGSKHVANNRMTTLFVCQICHGSDNKKQKDIVRSVSSTVCGQCHNRGKNKPFADQDAPVFNFPVQYTPGTDLTAKFTPLAPGDDKKNKYWWGNGVAKARHQEFADWGKSNHAKTLTLLKQNAASQNLEIQDTCLRCHSTDYLLSDSESKPTLRTAHYGITCVACHNPHRIREKGKPQPKRNEPCNSCHVDIKKGCAGKTAPVHFPCPSDKVQCVDCHMPYVVKSGGWFSIRGHAFVIVPPSDSANSGMPNSCQNGSCHQDRSLQWLELEYQKFYSTSSDAR